MGKASNTNVFKKNDVAFDKRLRLEPDTEDVKNQEHTQNKGLRTDGQTDSVWQMKKVGVR